MIKKISVVTFFLSIALLFSACGLSFLQPESTASTESLTTIPTEAVTTTPTEPIPTKQTEPVPTETEPTVTEETQPSDTTAPTEPTQATEPTPLHSPLYIEELEVEDVIRYFNEVCLDAEFANGGDASLVQKWAIPIYYRINGTPTDKDREVLSTFTAWLNTIEGFPGISETEDPLTANIEIHFCSQADILRLMGDNFSYVDGAVTFWYRDNAIHDATICYNTEANQIVRNSVILEEIYNGLGPVQDTDLRKDSIIFSGYSEPQSLTAVDELILKLLYHPQIKCGMNAAECEEVIRQLYY